MAIGESGSVVTAVGSTANPPTFTVSLSEPLTDPVFAFTSTATGPDGFTIRLTGQTLDGDGNTTDFTFILEEWEYLGGEHPASETINWLAIEEGVHTLPDGRTIEAGTSSVSSSAQNTGSSETFSANFTEPPVVLTSVMSNNDSATLDSDPSNITASGFELTLQEEEGVFAPGGDDGAHSAEIIGWIAIQAGGNSTSGTANVSGNSVTDAVSTISLGDTFTNAIVLAETQTLDGGDTATVVIDSQTTSTVTVSIKEEQSLNSETNHTTEVVGIVAFEDGLITCFTSGTKIAVPGGTHAIEELAIGDRVLTKDRTPQAICWIGRRKYTAHQLEQNPKLRPVRILAGALGQGLPKRDMLVSRQHRMLLQSRIAERMFGKSEVLVSAIKLTGLPGIFVDEAVHSVDYVHLLFQQHEIIYAEGTLTESLFTGPEALKSVSAEARQEILTIFPE